MIKGKGLWLTLLCLLLLAASASAGIASLDALQNHVEVGGAYELSVSAQVKAWPDITGASLEAAQTWLNGKRLNLALEQEGAIHTGQAQLFSNDQAVLGFFTMEGPEGAGFQLMDANGAAATRYHSAEGLPPWQLLLGVDTFLPDWQHAQAALQAIADLALPHLLEMEKPVKTSTSIKNAGRGASQLVYAYKTAEAQALWDIVAPKALPELDKVFAALFPQYAQAASQSLRTLEMKGALTIKRILDKDGKDLGLQITGTFALDGANRKLTLFFGQSDTGAYLSFKLPATRGNDTLELQLSIPVEENELAADWRFKWVTGKDSLSTTGVIALKAKAAEAGETLSGSLTLKTRQSGSLSRNTEYTVKPALAFDGLALSGTLAFQQKEGSSLDKDLVFTLNGEPVGPLQAPPALAIIEASALTPAQLLLEQARVQGAFLPQLTGFLSGLPQDQMRLILHDLGRVRRTNGDILLPPLDIAPAFTVTETTNPPQTKEDTP